jgi:hypothetical protein
MDDHPRTGEHPVFLRENPAEPNIELLLAFRIGAGGAVEVSVRSSISPREPRQGVFSHRPR